MVGACIIKLQSKASSDFLCQSFRLLKRQSSGFSVVFRQFGHVTVVCWNKNCSLDHKV